MWSTIIQLCVRDVAPSGTIYQGDELLKVPEPVQKRQLCDQRPDKQSSCGGTAAKQPQNWSTRIRREQRGNVQQLGIESRSVRSNKLNRTKPASLPNGSWRSTYLFWNQGSWTRSESTRVCRLNENSPRKTQIITSERLFHRNSSARGWRTQKRGKHNTSLASFLRGPL